jgi:hypothetical protein
MKAECSSDIAATIYKTTRNYPEHRVLDIHHSRNLKSRTNTSCAAVLTVVHVGLVILLLLLVRVAAVLVVEVVVVVVVVVAVAIVERMIIEVAAVALRASLTLCNTVTLPDSVPVHNRQYDQHSAQNCSVLQ